jgi:hypothetical protein
MSNKHVLIMQAKIRRDKAIRDAEHAAQEAIRAAQYAAQEAILAAVDAYDVAVTEIIEGMTSGSEVTAPVPSAPQGHSRGHLQLRPEDLENDEIFRQILRGFKTCSSTYFRLQ